VHSGAYAIRSSLERIVVEDTLLKPDAVAQEAKIILRTERDPVDAIAALERIGVQGVTDTSRVDARFDHPREH